MSALEIILIVLCSAFVIGVITKSLLDKRQGKCNCDCCDGNCSLCAHKNK